MADITIPLNKGSLGGELVIPADAEGMVIFAHGSGSSRFSPRNQYVAQELQAAGLGTLLFDLLTPAEEQRDDLTGGLRFDIPFLAGRLVTATKWLAARDDAKNLRLGYFGASTGAGAALIAAAQQGPLIGAVVSRGGRPDLAHEYLPKVQAPTLLIVGAFDLAVISMNKDALQQLTCEKKLAIIPRATHLFEEPGALENAAARAREWFVAHLMAVKKGV